MSSFVDSRQRGSLVGNARPDDESSGRRRGIAACGSWPGSCESRARDMGCGWICGILSEAAYIPK